MKTISGKVTSISPVSLAGAAAFLSDFAATETGASDAVSVYIRRAADAFNHLLQFHTDLSSNSVSNCNEKSITNRGIIPKQEEEEESVKVEQQFSERSYRKNKHKKEEIKAESVVNVVVKAESSLKNNGEIEGVEGGDGMKKKDKKKKNKSSESNEGVKEENLGVEMKKKKTKRKSGEIDGRVASDSTEQSSKRKNKKQRVEGK